MGCKKPTGCWLFLVNRHLTVRYQCHTSSLKHRCRMVVWGDRAANWSRWIWERNQENDWGNSYSQENRIKRQHHFAKISKFEAVKIKLQRSNMGKTIKTYLIQVVISFFAFGLILWPFNIIVDKDSTINAEFIFQCAVFALLFSAWSTYSNKKNSWRSKIIFAININSF